MKNSGKWTQEEIDKLIKLRDSGFTYSHISTVMGRSEDSLKGKMSSVFKKSIKKIKKQSGHGPEVEDYNRPWTEGEMQSLYELRKEGIPYQIIAQDLNRSVDSCKSKFSSTAWESLDYIQKNTNRSFERIHQAMKDQKRQKISDAYDRRIKNIRMGAEIVADHLAKCLTALPPISEPDKSWKIRKNANKQKHDAEDAVLVFSDIHAGAHHTLEETGGISEYNETILANRLGNLRESVRDIVELHSQLYDIPRLHIACLGDIVAGMNDVGEWSVNEISMDIMAQFTKGWQVLAECISYWLEIFDEVVFYGVRGNHGRVARRGVEKDKANWDVLCYIYLQLMFANNPRIKFVVPPTWCIVEEIKGHNVMMVHGDDIRANTYPIKKLADFQKEMSGIYEKKIDITLAGHFHSAAELSNNHGRALINGSVIGSDIYSLKDVHACSRPEQIFFGMHEKRGMTWKYNIDLEK